MLAVTGMLDRSIGGEPREVGELNNHRRTLYGTVKRRELNDLLRLHDVPDATTHSPGRIPTTTPLQQLYLLNSPFVQQQSSALARRLQTEWPGDVEGRIRRVYALLFGRLPTAGEVRLGREFLTGESSWSAYCQALLGSNEFLFVD